MHPPKIRVHHGQVRTIDSSGNSGRLKLKTVLAHEAAGRGSFNERGVFVFVRRIETAPKPYATVRHSPTIGRIVSRLVSEFAGRDSGFTTLNYPIGTRRAGKLQYSALERVGAGL